MSIFYSKFLVVDKSGPRHLLINGPLGIILPSFYGEVRHTCCRKDNENSSQEEKEMELCVREVATLHFKGFFAGVYMYSLHSILVDFKIDVSRYKIHLDTSI